MINGNLKNAKILIIDDQEMSVVMLERILEKEGYQNIYKTTDARKAAELYHEVRPDLLILDLNMPHHTGFEIMEQLKGMEGDSYLPILVISGEESQETKFEALKSGAKDFLNKPYDRVEVLIRIQNLIEVRVLHNQIRDQNKILEEKVIKRTQELYDTQLDVTQRLARAVEFRDSETGHHIMRMSHYSACLAAKAGFSMTECEMILLASSLHDIGKIAIPDSILFKPGKLTEEEWAIMKRHTVIGGDILSGSNSDILEMARVIAITHHERWDGSGYPEGLKEDEIPLIGRICGMCDVFDALLSKRPYKKAWTLTETGDEIKKGAGTQFDPKLVDLFVEILPQIRTITEKYSDLV